MAAALVPDGLWDVIEPLLPLPKSKPQGGRSCSRSAQESECIIACIGAGDGDHHGGSE
jgi:hypothetical protein